jgi:hypothetical protein
MPNPFDSMDLGCSGIIKRAKRMPWEPESLHQRNKINLLF